VKLILEVCKISELTRSSEHHLSFHDCGECPGPTDLENTLEDVFSDNAIENITFKQWISTDCCKLITSAKSTEELIESLLEKLLFLLHHTFIHSLQHSKLCSSKN
jgi:predicted metal-binding protein